MPGKSMRQIFSEDNGLQKWLDVEAALAKAEAAIGVIPKEAAEEIAKKTRLDLIDRGEIQRRLEEIGHPIVPVLHAVEMICEGDAGQYIHWGATSQDIMDTGTVLQIREAFDLIFNSLRDIEESLIILTEKHADTIIAGRTHGQHALPITFGYKVAVWLREVRRHIERLKECKPRLLVGQLSGAVGTMASFGKNGPEIHSLTMRELGLGAADICWQASRDRFAEFTVILAMTASTLGKIAHEIYSFQKTEVAELAEPFVAGRVGSSTMPHKRNPRRCEQIVALAKRIRYTAPMAIEAMRSEHERDRRATGAEASFIADACILFGDLLAMFQEIIRGLEVYPQRMEANLDILKGLILSEAFTMELGKKLGRLEAHDIIYQASMKAFEEDKHLKEILLQEPRVTKHLTEKEIDALLDARNYVGMAPQLAREMVDLTRKERGRDGINL